MNQTSQTSAPFQIQERSPELFRQATRNASIRIILVFVVAAMLCSTALVSGFGESGGENFKWNLAGVILGLLLTSALVSGLFRKQVWMSDSIYSWRLKRSLMSVTNQMHNVKAALEQQDITAMKTLRFYHLALHQMHQLDGNSSATSELVREMDAHAEHMTVLGLDLDQRTLHPDWLPHLKQLGKNKN